MKIKKPMPRFSMPEYATALLDYILWRVEVVYWNKFQEDWDHFDDPEIKGVKFNPYNWTYEESPTPNFQASGVKIWWYKYPGRCNESNKKMTPAAWTLWFGKVNLLINEDDRKHYGHTC